MNRLGVIPLLDSLGGLPYLQPLYNIKIISPDEYKFPRLALVVSTPDIQYLKRGITPTLRNASAELGRLHAQPRIRSPNHIKASTHSRTRQPITQPCRISVEIITRR